MFTPTNPTVYLLVDRSGSMFHCLTAKAGESTGDAVCTNTMTNTVDTITRPGTTSRPPSSRCSRSSIRRSVRLQHGLRIEPGRRRDRARRCRGCSPTTSRRRSTTRRPSRRSTTVLLFRPTAPRQGIKFESPISESIGNVTKALMADTDPGSKYIILITDGQPDYLRRLELALRARLGDLEAAELPTPPASRRSCSASETALFDLAPGVLQAFANAGAGEPTLAPVKTGGTAIDFYDQCSGVAGWAADLTATGTAPARGDTLGTYSTDDGPDRSVYAKRVRHEHTALVAQLSTALSGRAELRLRSVDVHHRHQQAQRGAGLSRRRVRQQDRPQARFR